MAERPKYPNYHEKPTGLQRVLISNFFRPLIEQIVAANTGSPAVLGSEFVTSLVATRPQMARLHTAIDMTRVKHQDELEPICPGFTVVMDEVPISAQRPDRLALLPLTSHVDGDSKMVDAAFTMLAMRHNAAVIENPALQIP